MIEYMVIAAPRSSTAWVSNWLTTDTTLCLHDPLWTRHYLSWDRIASRRRLGVACTGIALFPQWVNAHPARKVVLHRDPQEINRSLECIGLPELGPEWRGALERIEGLHCAWRDVFDRPAPIYEHLLERPFDVERHQALRTIEMQPHFAGLTVGREVTRKLLRELAAA